MDFFKNYHFGKFDCTDRQGSRKLYPEIRFYTAMFIRQFFNNFSSHDIISYSNLKNTS